MTTTENFRTFIQRCHCNNDLVVFPTGMGSELSELGRALEFPLWSAGALLDDAGCDLIRQVHLNAVALGQTDVITTCTWTRRTAFQEVGENWQEASRVAFSRGVRLAVDVKREVQEQQGRALYVGGSFGPLMDSYHYDPNKRPSKDYLLETHNATARILVEAAPYDLDFLIPETVCSAWEALPMAQAASSTGKPFIIGLRLDEKGDFGDGESLKDTVAEISALKGFTALALNCLDARLINAGLEKVRDDYDGPLIIYANGFGEPHANGSDWNLVHAAAAEYCDLAVDWIENKDVTGVGGCCGTTAHSYGRHIAQTLQTKKQRMNIRHCSAA